MAQGVYSGHRGVWYYGEPPFPRYARGMRYDAISSLISRLLRRLRSSQ